MLLESKYIYTFTFHANNKYVDGIEVEYAVWLLCYHDQIAPGESFHESNDFCRSTVLYTLQHILVNMNRCYGVRHTSKIFFLTELSNILLLKATIKMSRWATLKSRIYR